MSTSQFGYIVSTDSAVQYAADEPLDAISARVLVNNACHYMDEAAQVRVTFGDPAGVPGLATAAYTSNWQILSWVFPVTRRQSGDTYRFRIRIAGYATGGAAVKFRAVIGTPTATGPRTTWGGSGDREFLTASAGGSDAWLTGASQGANAWIDMIYMPAALVMMQSFQTVDAIGGNVRSVSVPTAQLTVYGTSSKGLTDPPLLTAVYLAEVIGT